MLEATIFVQQSTSIGRLDALAEIANTIFIIEFKINSMAQKALEQVRTKKYHEP
jgi:hypothetical protein